MLSRFKFRVEGGPCHGNRFMIQSNEVELPPKLAGNDLVPYMPGVYELVETETIMEGEAVEIQGVYRLRVDDELRRQGNELRKHLQWRNERLSNKKNS